MFYSHYRGRTGGRLMHFLSIYGNTDIASTAIFCGDSKIAYRGKPFATFTWETAFGRRDVPKFTFVGEESDWLEAQQLRKLNQAIEEGLCYRDITVLSQVSESVVRVLCKDAYRHAHLWSQITERPIEFYIGKTTIESYPEEFLFAKLLPKGGTQKEETYWLSNKSEEEWLRYA